MSMMVVWENRQRTVLRQVLTDAWTWDEFDASLDRILEMLHGVCRVVDVICDSRGSVPPTPVEAWAHFRAQAAALPPNLGRIVIVADEHDHPTALLFSVLSKFYTRLDRRTLFVDTLSEAHAALNRPELYRRPVRLVC
jgi:hypothetical protein